MWIPKGIEVKKDDEITSSNLADYIMNISKEEITYDFMMSTFGSFEGSSKAHVYDLIKVPIGKFSFVNSTSKTVSNKNEFTTTIGIFLFNILLSSFNFSKFFDGYINKSIDKKQYGKIGKRLSYALIEDEITVEDLKQWENTMQWLMPFEDVLSPNHTEKLISCTKVLNKKKDELIKKYQKEIDAGDIAVVEQIEKELLAYAKEYLGDDPAMDTILSGAGGVFNNNFKNMFVMKGAIRNPDPNAKKKYDIVTSNYIDGISADEYSIIAGSGASGAYSRGKKTETGGYWEKLFVSAYQHIQLDAKGSDCGTSRHIVVDLNENNIGDYMYCYAIKSNGDLELINSKTSKNYIGKRTKIRFSSMCESKTGICNKCAGELLYVGAENIGMTMAQIPSTLKLKCMKGFHDSTIKTTQFDAMKAFFPFEG